MALRFQTVVVFASTLLVGALEASEMPAETNVVAAADSATNAPNPRSFDSFKIISDRNIFNQNRSPRSARREPQRSRPVPVVESLALVGTMSYGKGDFAFFDGSKSEFRKPVKAGDKIAGYDVREVKASCVKIANNTQQFEIKVGQHLRKEDDGEWQLSTADRVAASTATTSESGPPSATSSSGNASEDEALKRLMEKRAKEMNQ